MEKFFKGFTVEFIERNKNADADELAKAAARNVPMPDDVFFQIIKDASIKTVEEEPRMINVITGEDWRAPIMAYLRNIYEPETTKEEKRMYQRAKAYQIVNDKLYRSSITGIMLRCLSKQEGKNLLQEIHSGVCGGHIGARALAAKAFRQGFYWPSAIDDASQIVAKCIACKKFSPRQTTPSQYTTAITPSWPLQRWGIDLVGPLPTAQGGYRYAIVAVEYFTKWIEAKPLVNITAAAVQRFFWQNIICRFGVPREITVDNGKQFDNSAFREFCYQIGTTIAFASVYHPQSNGVVERANALIFMSIKKKLEGEKKGKWAEELPRATWSHNTTVSRATKFTPFRLLYGDEAVTPEEIKFQSARTQNAATTSTAEAEAKDFLEEERLKAVANLESYENETKSWRDKKVKVKTLDVGDTVLLRSPHSENLGKLDPKWQGPCIITGKNGPGSFRLADEEGNTLPHSWNADNLRRFFM